MRTTTAAKGQGKYETLTVGARQILLKGKYETLTVGTRQILLKGKCEPLTVGARQNPPEQKAMLKPKSNQSTD